MTLCVGALCDNRKSIVLVADRMFGVGFAEAELNIRKAASIHKDWMIMIAGNDVSPAFDIIDELQQSLKAQSCWTVRDVIQLATKAFKDKRMKDAETKYLSSRGWTMDEFRKTGLQLLGQIPFDDLDRSIQNAALSLDMMVAGFDGSGTGHIFSVVEPGLHSRHDVNGFHAIGSGSVGAYYMLLWRELKVQMPLETALYLSQEAKIFGEQAGGVGFESDIYIMRHGQKTRKLTRGSVRFLDRVWNDHKPKDLTKQQKRQLARVKEVKSIRQAVKRPTPPKRRQAATKS